MYAMQDNNRGREVFQDIADGLAREARGFQRNIVNARDAREQRLRGLPVGSSERTRLERQIEHEQQIEARAADAVIGLYSSAGQAAVNVFSNEMNAQANLEQARERALAEGFANNRGAMDRLRHITEQIKDPKMLLSVLGYVALGTFGIAGMYYGTKVLYNYVTMKMGKPKLVRESSRHGFSQSFKNFFMSAFSDQSFEDPKLSDIILAPDVELKINMLAQDTRETREYHLPYQNILLYGPPGTGKTEFARILAHYSDMDYAILSGADFAQFKGGAAIEELHKLFDWAKKSSRGLLIFLDEADACLRDRGKQDKDGVNFINAFLSQTGANSDKYMIVLATNYEDELDAAVRSRIHKKVPFNLPSLEERVKIVKQKIDKYVVNDKRKYHKDDEEIEAFLTMGNDINDEYITEIAQRIKGFSGRDIDQSVSEMRLRAYRSGQNLLTKEIVDLVVRDKIKEVEKDKLATMYQQQSQQAQFITSESAIACAA